MVSVAAVLLAAMVARPAVQQLLILHLSPQPPFPLGTQSWCPGHLPLAILLHRSNFRYIGQDFQNQCLFFWRLLKGPDFQRVGAQCCLTMRSLNTYSGRHPDSLVTSETAGFRPLCQSVAFQNVSLGLLLHSLINPEMQTSCSSFCFCFKSEDKLF